MSYITIKDYGKAEFEEKKSVFIGEVIRVKDENEAREFLNKVKLSHKEARHNVYAYVIGPNMGIQRCSDDGEPQGTGGIPVLETIKKMGITDVIIVVTRYFGGILLGTGGLARAYGRAASMACQEGGIVEKVEGRAVKITIDYESLNKLQYSFEQNSWHIEDIEYSENVKIKIYAEIKNIDKIIGTVTEITSGKGIIDMEDKCYFFKEGNRLYLC